MVLAIIFVLYNMKVSHSCLEISMLVAFLCIGHVLTADVSSSRSSSGLPKLPEKTIGDGHFFCRLKAIHDVPGLWHDHKVPYSLQTTGYSEEEVQRLKAGIASWNEQVPEIQFVPWKGNDTDFVNFVFSPDGCFSAVGRLGGPQDLHLDPDCLTDDTIHHEMMHVIGFSHEHNRRDRRHYVQVLWDNIPVEWMDQYEENDFTSPNHLGPYEYLSNMHYPIESPENDDLPAFRILKEGVNETAMGATDLTKLDKMKIRRLYGSD